MPTLYQLKSTYKAEGDTYELTVYARDKKSARNRARKYAIGAVSSCQFKRMKVSKDAYIYLLKVVDVKLEKG